MTYSSAEYQEQRQANKSAQKLSSRFYDARNGRHIKNHGQALKLPVYIPLELQVALNLLPKNAYWKHTRGKLDHRQLHT
jgi:hypothetical protein